MTNDKPLIWTTKGNVPVETLTYFVSWEDMPDYVKFTETYKDGDEVVKQSSHVMSKKGISSEAVAQSF